MASAFIIRPFGNKQDSTSRWINFEDIHASLIEPALAKAGVAGGTTGEIIEAGNIREDMFGQILSADLVICDITIHNANVFYELGIRHSLRKRATILIRGEPPFGEQGDAVPFDILTDRFLSYPLTRPDERVEALTKTIEATIRSDRPTDSPLFLMLPSLAETAMNAIAAVPSDFAEDVELAARARSEGWLRLLSVDVQGLRFEMEGLRRIGAAQVQLKDFEGARDTWERVRDVYFRDIPANLALANIYERLHRKYGKVEFLGLSEAAVERVLAQKNISLDTKAEAKGQKARNSKTRWRLEFRSETSVEDRRQKALRQEMFDCHQLYYEAYMQDLNSYWTGLAAAQMAFIARDLARKPGWYGLFGDEDEAELEKRRLEKWVPVLIDLVSASVDANEVQGKNKDVWFKVTRADIAFLKNDRIDFVLNKYRSAIPRREAFAWDSARGQLELFRDLGVKVEMANEVIDQMDAQLLGSTTARPIQDVVIFAGHRVDDPSLTGSLRRFPPEAESKARALIKARLEGLVRESGGFLEGFSSAAPGADILFHEVCDELGVQSTICLPVRRDAYSTSAFGYLDSWKNRFLDLLHAPERILELSQHRDLPRWMGDSRVNLWERGNQWVFNHALSRGRGKVYLLVLWDGTESLHPGGTAQMVELARNSPRVRIEIISTSELSSGHS